MTITNPETTQNPIPQERFEGKIIHIDEKGFGFIACDKIPFTRIFFHWTALVGDTLNFIKLERNMRVSFNAVEIPDYQNKDGSISRKGWRAIRVRVIDDVCREA